MRRKISESNVFPKFDLYKEYAKIEYLLSECSIIGTYNHLGDRLPPRFTMEQYVNDLYFSDWNLRGTFISIAEMREGLGISRESITKRSVTEEKVLDFIQYAANCTLRVSSTIKHCDRAYIADRNHIDVMIENMKALAEKLGAYFTNDPNTAELFVVYSDDLSAVVSEDYPEIKASLLDYKKIDSAGDLRRKGEILCTLFKRLEPVEKKFKGTTYEQLCSDTTFLFNKTGARHWIEKDYIASKTFFTMSPTELESWYDRTYTMFLSCMVISQYLDIHKEVQRIKQV